MKFSKLVILFLPVALLSCRSVHNIIPKDKEPLNYEKPDIVANEIDRINSFLETDVTQALFRAVLLGQNDVIETCVAKAALEGENAKSNKDYLKALSIARSLKSIGSEEKLSFSALELESTYLDDVPGINGKKTKTPKNLSDCINATVTIWVDKGIKVTYGVGVSDSVVGSGFFIDERGYIITNHHVIADLVDPEYEGYARLYIKLASDPETKIPAKVIGYDSILDLALLKTEAPVPCVLELDFSNDLSAGDKVTVIGSPYGLDASVSQGIISSTDRKLFTQGNVFQLDASVNPGNSGGPCIGENMKVQAVAFASIISSQGLNFAIPIEYLIQELPYLYNGGEFAGELNHNWISCYGKTRKTGNGKNGVDLFYVIPGGSAVYSGLKKGDIITWCDGKDIDSLETLQSVFRTHVNNTILKARAISEESGEKEIFIFLEKRPKDPARLVYESDTYENSFVALYGMKLSHSSTNSRKTYRIDWVIPGSYADENKFSENDIITILDVKPDNDSKYIISQVYIKQIRTGYLDFGMTLGTNFDSPYYF